MSAITKKPAAWPVVEVFGPTVQGEGIDQGVVAHFVRFGGCDYRCSWCDTPYAVLPDQVRANATKMTAEDIDAALRKLDNPAGGCAPWVILTGGNPALHDLQELVDELHASGYMVAVETQGSRWREWMRDVDRLCVSPKPPSAKEPKTRGDQVARFMDEALRAKIDGSKPYEWMFLKVVVFDDEDLEFAERMRAQLSDALLFLSAGNDAGQTVGDPDRIDQRTLSAVRRDLCDKTAWLAEQVMQRPRLCVLDVFIQQQLHTAMWGNGRGF